MPDIKRTVGLKYFNFNMRSHCNTFIDGNALQN